MAGAMAEVRAVASLVDDVTGRLIDLPALQGLLGSEPHAHPGDGGVAGPGHDLKDLLVTRRHVLADEARPGQVTVDGARPIEFAPQIDEHEIALADRRVGVRSRSIVRIGAVRADADNRRVIADQAMLLEVIENALLHLGFAD